MTVNDNIRHYIGDLETTEDIDIVFKHIYDLMLANGGENSGLNADMVDGYHASDFAPASLKDEIDKCIHSITWGGEKYTGRDIVLEILANKILFFRAENPNPIDIETFLNEVDNRILQTEDTINDMENTIDFLNNDETRDALSQVIQNNINSTTDEDGDTHIYLNSDSVNGLSFQILTQDEYDILPNHLKLDPRNIYIINNELEHSPSHDSYVPPSILQAGMNLEFRINTATNNIEFSVDGKKIDSANKVWKILMPLVGSMPNDNDPNPESKKGLLYPQWFSLIKDVVDSHAEFQNQEDYPFLLNTFENRSQLAEEFSGDKISGITIGNNTIEPSGNNNAVNLSDALNNYLNTWISTHASTIENTIDFNNKINTAIQNANHESQANRITSTASGGLSGNSSDSKYPTTKAVVNYVDSIKASLQQTIQSYHQDTGWKKMAAYTQFFKESTTSNKTAYVWFRKIGPVVYLTASLFLKTSMQINEANDYWFVCDIPDGLVPLATCRFIGQGSTTDRCFLFADREHKVIKLGRVDFQNKRQTGQYTLPKDYWISFSATYLA